MIRVLLRAGAARAAAALVLLAAAALALSMTASPAPRLDAVAPQVISAGRVLSLQGRFFGRERGIGTVTFAGRAPRTGAYRLWSDRRIEVVAPASFAGGLVRVVTRAGASGGLLVTRRGDLPAPVAGERPRGGPPIVTRVSPAAAAIGAPITIDGAGFGASGAGGAVRFTAAAGRAVESSVVDLDHVRWSDRRIVVRVPAGAGSGALSVRTAAGVSGERAFEVLGAAGRIRSVDPRGYAATYAVTVDGVDAAGGAAVYLWIPAIPATPAQRHESPPAGAPQPLLRGQAGVDLFRLAGAGAVRRHYRLLRYAIRTEVEPSDVRAYRTDTAFYARFTGGDAVVPAGGRLPAIAAEAMRGYVNPLWRARMVFRYVVERLTPAADAGARLAPASAAPMQVVLAAIDERRAAPYEYAVTFSAIARAAGIPARPVAGFLIGAGARAAPHYWAEFYLQDAGWAPVDPAAADGAAGVALPAPGGAAGDPFFGDLDNRRIALAKGVFDPRRIGRARRVLRPEVAGLQTAHEDVVGAPAGHRTRWQELTITARF